MSDDIFSLKIVTPEGEHLSEEVEFVKCFSVSGDLGIYAQHTDSVIQLRDTDVHYELGEAKSRVFVSAGVLSIDSGNVTILTDSVENPDSIDVEKELGIIKTAEESYKNAADYADQEKYRHQVLTAKAKIRITEQ